MNWIMPIVPVESTTDVRRTADENRKFRSLRIAVKQFLSRHLKASPVVKGTFPMEDRDGQYGS